MSTLLITGQPGAGKTLYAVSEILQKYVDAGRPIFCAGLEGLKLPYQPFPPVEEWTERRQVPDMPGTTAPFFTFPPDSVLVWDECQSIFPTRSTNSRAPDHVVAFTTHRKTGIDCILITQRPKQMDSMLQGLVNEHRHIRRIWGMSRAVIYTWDQCSLNMSNYREATRKVWQYPKKAFTLYTSATAHTAQISRPPLLLYLIPLLLVAAVVTGYFAYSRISAKTSGIASPVGLFTGSPSAPTNQNLPLSSSEFWAPTQYYPADATRPESAPVYAGLVQPVTAPVVAGCIASARKCTCFTQQATSLDVPEDFCREFALNGRFDPYRQAIQPVQQAAPVYAAPVEPLPTASGVSPDKLS